MEEVNKVTVALKNHHQSLHMGDAMINELQDVSEKYKNKLSRDHATSKVNVWFRSHFTVHKALTSYAALCPDHCSQNGVCRIQQEQWLTLTNAETEPCEPLLKGNIGSIDSEIYQEPLLHRLTWIRDLNCDCKCCGLVNWNHQQLTASLIQLLQQSQMLIGACYCMVPGRFGRSPTW